MGERGELQIKRKKGRECEGEIEELWFSSTQLQTATAVTSLHLLLALPLLLFLPSFSYFVPLLSAFTLGCISNESRLQTSRYNVNSNVLMTRAVKTSNPEDKPSAKSYILADTNILHHTAKAVGFFFLSLRPGFNYSLH